MMRRMAMQWLGAAVLLMTTQVATSQAADAIWPIQAVDGNGLPTDPRVGGDPMQASSWVSVEGIALNASSEMLPSSMWQVFVQGEAPDAGGIACWHGSWFNPEGWPWPPFPDVQPGDRIRVDALISGHNGKVNINSRHSSDPGMQFVVTVLQAGVGMPIAKLVPSVADALIFDQTRATGGEHYQGQWSQLNDVELASGTWAPGETLTITDAGGDELNVFLSGPGDFAGYAAPVGSFNVRGIFDQEDPDLPYDNNYRLWVKKFADFRFPLTVEIVNEPWGAVSVTPDANDPNLPEVAPDDANNPCYPGGTEVTLTASPIEGKVFEGWTIYDPNFPGDANHAAQDTNAVLTLVMADAQHVVATFRCGSDMGPMLPIVLLAGLTLHVMRRRR